MKIEEVTFTREELNDYMELLGSELCCDRAIQCGGIDCDRCPLADLSDEQALKYIEEHLEEEEW